MDDSGHESLSQADRPDSVNVLLCEWRDARIGMWKCSGDDAKKLGSAIDRLGNAENALHRFALGVTLTESSGKEQTNSRDPNILTDGTNG